MRVGLVSEFLAQVRRNVKLVGEFLGLVGRKVKLVSEFGARVGKILVQVGFGVEDLSRDYGIEGR